MATYNLDILQSTVFERISALTHYTGAKMTADSSAYDRIATIDANDEILSRFWLQAVNQLVIFLSPFAGNIYYTKNVTTGEGDDAVTTVCNGIFVQLTMTSNWDSHLLPALTQAAENYLVARIAELWFRMTDKASAQEQLADATSSATELRILLYSKTRPSLPADYINTSDGSCDDGTTDDEEDDEEDDETETT